MKNAITYYVLIVLLIMGAFASMALNSYGVTLMGYAALGFGLLFLYELVLIVPRSKSIHGTDKTLINMELLALTALSLIYFLRSMTIEIPFVDKMVLALSVMLLIVNAYFLYRAWSSVRQSPPILKIAVAFYFMALFLVWLAGYLTSFQNSTVLIITLLAITSLAGFFITGWWKGKVIVEGIETSGIQEVSKFRNKSTLQLMVLVLVMAYFSLSNLDILPPLYFGSLPNGYSKLVKQADENAKTTGPRVADPKAFEDAYKKFIKGK